MQCVCARLPRQRPFGLEWVSGMLAAGRHSRLHSDWEADRVSGAEELLHNGWAARALVSVRQG